MATEETFFTELGQEKGDFYVMCDECTACGAPESEAPDLIDHSKLNYSVCYFKKQPETSEEIWRAINAMAVSCVDALRYRGTDEAILKRLYEAGYSELCDAKPVGNYKVIVRNRVTFNYTGTIDGLSAHIIGELSRQSHIGISNFRSDGKSHFEFIYKWYEGVPGMVYRCNFNSNYCEIAFTRKEGKELTSTDGWLLHHILINDNNASEITWYDMDESNTIRTPLPY